MRKKEKEASRISLEKVQDVAFGRNEKCATHKAYTVRKCIIYNIIFLFPVASVGSGRYDPELLKQDVHSAKLRVVSLRQEVMQIRKEVSIKQQGLNTLTQVEQKMSTGSCYTMGEAQAIMNELRSIQRSLISGEKERMELMQCLARHKEDLTRLQSMTKFPDIASSLDNSTEKLSTASQTDLSGDVS